MGRVPDGQSDNPIVARAVNLLPDSPSSWIGYALAVITAATVWYRDRRKNDIDESALVLGKWKELVEQHQSDIRAIKEEFAAYKTAATAEFAAYKAASVAENADLRLRLGKAENRITELETENAGLKRAIAQNSQSTAYQLGGGPRRNSLPGEGL